MSAPVMEAVTAQRLTLLDNGYAPLPLVEKQCFIPGWAKLVVDRNTIHKWRRMLRYKGTGIRIENGLAVIDIDIDDPAAVGAIVERLRVLLPGSLLLVRHGNGAKIAIFVRTFEPFGRFFTYRWIKPGETEDDGAHGVEIFGGGSPRQFGAFGRCGPDSNYRWAGRSPLDTGIDELPVFTKDQFFSVLDAAEGVLRQQGWQNVKRSTRGDNASRRVRDLTDDMRFECNDGETRTLAQLEALARLHGIQDLRCSASWLEQGAKNRTRCIIGATKNGMLTIWESASYVTHMPRTGIDDLIAEKLRKLAQDRPSALDIIEQEWRRRAAAKAGTRK